MATHQYDAVVNAPLSTVIDNFEAFLWADDRRVEEDHEPGTTTAVARINRTTFEEVETLDLGFSQLQVTTRYQLAADPQGTRITLSYELPDVLESLMLIMGLSPDGETAQQVPAWVGRLTGYLATQKQVGDGTAEVA